MRNVRLMLTLFSVLASTSLFVSGGAAAPSQRTHAEALIAEGGGPSVWTLSEQNEVRHIQSGMKCIVPAGDDAIQLTDLFEYPKQNPGDDVSCEFSRTGKGNETTITLYAYRAQQTSAREWFDTTTKMVLVAHPDWRRDGAPDVTIASTDANGVKLRPHTATFSFKAEDGNPYRSGVWLGSVNGWIIKVRATYAASEARVNEARAGKFWANAVDDVRSHEESD